MFNKKIIIFILSFILSFFMILNNFQFTQIIVKASTDVTPPELKGISIDKTVAVAGESITITADITDNGGSGFKSGYVVYYTPITKKTRNVDFSYADNKHTAKLNLTEQEESGTWQIGYISLRDNLDNSRLITNSKVGSGGDESRDLSNCNFENTKA